MTWRAGGCPKRSGARCSRDNHPFGGQVSTCRGEPRQVATCPTYTGSSSTMTDDTPEPPRQDPKRRRGLIIVNTGDGKGKTTAALGLAFRALGSGFKVFMVQYIKGKWKTGEKKLADRLAPDIQILPMGDGFTWDTQNPAQDIATTLKIWEVSKEAIASGRYD